MNNESAQKSDDRSSSDFNALAFMVEIEGYDCICFASTKGKAKWIAVAGARAAGFIAKRCWPSSLNVRREKKYDKSNAKKYGKGPYVESYVLGQM